MMPSVRSEEPQLEIAHVLFMDLVSFSLLTAEEQAARIQQEAEQEASRKLDDLQGEVERIRNESRATADRLQREAEQESARLHAEATQTLERARAEAAQTLDRARAEANSVLASLTGQRDMLVTELRATRRHLSELVSSIDATVESTPAFPLSGPSGKSFDPWAESPAAPPQPPEPVVVPESAEAVAADPHEHVDPFAAPRTDPVAAPRADTFTEPGAGTFSDPDPFEAPAPEAGLFDDFATGPSYEGTGTGEPLFDDPDLRPSYGETERPAGYVSNGFQAGGVGHAEFGGEPVSFELPEGEALDLGHYAEDDDEPEVTPTIELSLPDIPSFGDEENEPDQPDQP